MLRIVGWNSYGLVDDRKLFGVLGFRHLDAPLNVAHGVEILLDFALVLRTDDLAESCHFTADEIENTLIPANSGHSRSSIRAAGGSEQPLENRAGIILNRQRRCRCAPCDCVGVGATRTTVAISQHGVGLDAELDRSKLSFFGELFGRDLIYRYRSKHVGAGSK